MYVKCFVENSLMNNESPCVIAIDFDGCLCSNEWPKIGVPNNFIIDLAKSRQAEGCKLILWTCREGDLLKEAVEWCKIRGLHFDAINENLPERIAEYGCDPRKIGADEYWDDHAINVTIVEEDVLL